MPPRVSIAQAPETGLEMPSASSTNVAQAPSTVVEAQHQQSHTTIGSQRQQESHKQSNRQQQMRCYLCETPKREYSLVRRFSEVVCRGCLNYEGPDRLEQLIGDARRHKEQQSLGGDATATDEHGISLVSAAGLALQQASGTRVKRNINNPRSSAPSNQQQTQPATWMQPIGPILPTTTSSKALPSAGGEPRPSYLQQQPEVKRRPPPLAMQPLPPPMLPPHSAGVFPQPFERHLSLEQQQLIANCQWAALSGMANTYSSRSPVRPTAPTLPSSQQQQPINGPVVVTQQQVPGQKNQIQQQRQPMYGQCAGVPARGQPMAQASTIGYASIGIPYSQRPSAVGSPQVGSEVQEVVEVGSEPTSPSKPRSLLPIPPQPPFAASSVSPFSQRSYPGSLQLLMRQHLNPCDQFAYELLARSQQQQQQQRLTSNSTAAASPNQAPVMVSATADHQSHTLTAGTTHQMAAAAAAAMAAASYPSAYLSSYAAIGAHQAGAYCAPPVACYNPQPSQQPQQHQQKSSSASPVEVSMCRALAADSNRKTDAVEAFSSPSRRTTPSSPLPSAHQHPSSNENLRRVLTSNTEPRTKIAATTLSNTNHSANSLTATGSSLNPIVCSPTPTQTHTSAPPPRAHQAQPEVGSSRAQASTEMEESEIHEKAKHPPQATNANSLSTVTATNTSTAANKQQQRMSASGQQAAAISSHTGSRKVPTTTTTTTTTQTAYHLSRLSPPMLIKGPLVVRQPERLEPESKARTKAPTQCSSASVGVTPSKSPQPPAQPTLAPAIRRNETITTTATTPSSTSITTSTTSSTTIGTSFYQQTRTFKCLICCEQLADRHFVQCPAVQEHRFCFSCSRRSIQQQCLVRHGNDAPEEGEKSNKCPMANEHSAWTFMANEIETIFKDSGQRAGGSRGTSSTSTTTTITASARDNNSHRHQEPLTTSRDHHNSSQSASRSSRSTQQTPGRHSQSTSAVAVNPRRLSDEPNHQQFPRVDKTLAHTSDKRRTG